MISATVEQPGGAEAPGRGAKRLKLWIAVVLVFAAQVGALFWAGNPPSKAAAVPVGPVVHMAGAESRELLALQDPTLFILPHRNNFSGDAWLKIRPQVFSPTNWTEPARPLDLPVEELGAAFIAFMQTNPPPPFQPRIGSGLDTADVVPPPMSPITTPSRLRVEGDLARLRLLASPALPPQTNSDLLTNTVIQIVVDAQGRPFSSVIVGKSGKDDADAEALTNYARNIRFAPLQAATLESVPSDRMISGKLVFEWQTMPSNAPPANP